MPTPKTTLAYAWEDGAGIAMARVVGWNNIAITQSAITRIDYQVTNKVTGVSVISGQLTVSSVVFNTLQTPLIWDFDADGYNFRHDLPATAFPNPQQHRIDYKFTPQTGEVFLVTFDVEVLETFMS